jgi:hypothetical protein
MKQGPILSGTLQTTGENDSVEWHIVLAHELIQLYIVRVLPPFLPVWGIIGSNGWVANRGIIPNIKHFALETWGRNWSTPLQIASDATWLESFLKP